VLSIGDSERVADLMRETAAAELLPRFRNLSKEEIREKTPGDVVTVVDLAAEQRLASGLAKVLQGVPVIGEEAVESDPGLLELIGRPGESCWIVDPLDGTANFAAGRDTFAMIVCLVRNAETIAGWILDVPHGRMAVAHKGEGAAVDGLPIGENRVDRAPCGLVGYKVRKEFDRQLTEGQRRRLGRLSISRCAGVDYIEILSGRMDFCLYRMSKPWDHAAGALMLTEAGGGAVRFDGADYGPSQDLNSGIIAARSRDVLAEVRSVFAMVRMPLFERLS
jgi:fructose-1,6-bisphosphatase/inositol monophosphatase family enzyme